jgi:hypothetical protein
MGTGSQDINSLFLKGAGGFSTAEGAESAEKTFFKAGQNIDSSLTFRMTESYVLSF